MDNALGASGDNSKRLNIDRKMMGILSVFTVLGVCLVIGIVVATNTLSGLRGFATLQTNWTEARKEATMQLTSYMLTGEYRYLSRFDSALKSIHRAHDLRQELLKRNTDYEAARAGFLELNAVPEDVDNMITTFRYFHDFSDFRKAIEEWDKSDGIIEKMEELAVESRKKMEEGVFNGAVKEQSIQSLYNLDRNLTGIQYTLAAALSSGSRFLKTIILWVSSSLGLILLITGGTLSLRFSKSLKKWRRNMQVNEQRYRSLFDQNPHAVYSINREGLLMDGNKIFEQMTGSSLDDLKGEKFVSLLEAGEMEKVREHFEIALEGVPLTFEMVRSEADGQQKYFEITNLPIYVDGEIIGVYGIAYDITVRKEAEEKIKEQLDEKIHLLAEIHDRVKNNLALISSLMQLKKETVETTEGKDYLDSTISRVHSIAKVHEHMYHTETFSSVRFDEYVKGLRSSFIRSNENMANPHLVINSSPVILNINQAIPSALLLNELLTYVFRYSSGGSQIYRITLSLYQENGQVVMKIAANGSSLPEKYNLDNPQTLELRLIKVLIKQLNGAYEIDQNGGSRITIYFKNKEIIEKSDTA